MLIFDVMVWRVAFSVWFVNDRLEFCLDTPWFTVQSPDPALLGL